MKQCILLMMTLIAFCANAQNLSLTFTSITDAKFFVYVNGALQNERSSGMVKVNGLEDKDYHIRIVIDDPFEIAVTRTIKPSVKQNEYTVQFNAVRERVYLKPAQSSRQQESQNLWIPEDNSAPETSQSEAPAARQHTSLRCTQTSDTATQRIINRLRTKTLEDD